MLLRPRILVGLFLVLGVLGLPVIVAAPAQAALCENDSTGLVAIPDLVPGGTYKGEDGGLYPGGTNTPPAPYVTAGNAAADAVVPRNAEGAPDPNGKIVLVGIGGSVAKNEFQAFIDRVEDSVNPNLVIVNGAQGGQDTDGWLDPMADAWIRLDDSLETAGVTPAQVGAIWMKSVYKSPKERDFPTWVADNADGIRTMIDNADVRYTNLSQVMLSSRTYGDYLENLGRTIEPWAYEHGFAVKELVAEAVAAVGAEPWVGWGPYLWTDGVDGRDYDEFIWECRDVDAQGSHASVEFGEPKIAALLDEHYSESPFTPWFRAGVPTGFAVTSVNPESLPPGASLTVDVRGREFVAGATVNFGPGVTVNSVTFRDSGLLEVNLSVSDGAALGERTVTVTNPDSSSASCGDCFSVVVTTAPTLESVEPMSLPIDSGSQPATLIGSNFVDGATVTFGERVTVRDLSFVSATRLDLSVRVLADALPGPRTVTVTNPDGSVASCDDCFSVEGDAPAPDLAVTSASPASLAPGSGTQVVTLTGSGFVATPTVSFGSGVTVRSLSYVDQGRLDVTVRVQSTATPGLRTVTATNPDSSSASCSDCFSVEGDAPAPDLAVTSASPASLAPGSGTQVVTLTGSGFVGTPTVSFGAGVSVRKVAFVNQGQLEVTVRVAASATLGPRTVTVTNPDGASDTCECFSVSSP